MLMPLMSNSFLVKISHKISESITDSSSIFGIKNHYRETCSLVSEVKGDPKSKPSLHGYLGRFSNKSDSV
jgi:hypothetical protein